MRNEIDVTIAAANQAPVDAQYVVVALNGTLTAERRLQVSNPLKLSDGGANGDITLSLEESLTAGSQAPVVPAWIKVTKTFADFAAAATSNTITLFTLPAKGLIHEVFAKHTVQFGGGSLTAYTMRVGVPGNDGKVIRIPIPPLTEERRKELVRLTHKIAEEGRVAIRNIRHDANKRIHQAQKDGEVSEDEMHRQLKEIQDLTDKHIATIDQMLERKEQEVMEV